MLCLIMYRPFATGQCRFMQSFRYRRMGVDSARQIFRRAPEHADMIERVGEHEHARARDQAVARLHRPGAAE